MAGHRGRGIRGDPVGAARRPAATRPPARRRRRRRGDGGTADELTAGRGHRLAGAAAPAGAGTAASGPAPAAAGVVDREAAADPAEAVEPAADPAVTVRRIRGRACGRQRSPSPLRAPGHDRCGDRHRTRGGVAAVVEAAGPGRQAAAADAADAAARRSRRCGRRGHRCRRHAGEAACADPHQERRPTDMPPGDRGRRARDRGWHPRRRSGRAAAGDHAAEPVEARRLEQHFVYNSLNAIASLIRTDPAPGAGAARRLRRPQPRHRPARRRPEHLGARAGRRAGLPGAGAGPVRQAPAGRDRRRPGRSRPSPVEPLRLLAAVRDAVQRDIEPRAQGGVLSVTARPADGGCVVTVTGGAGEPRVLALTAPRHRLTPGTVATR